MKHKAREKTIENSFKAMRHIYRNKRRRGHFSPHHSCHTELGESSQTSTRSGRAYCIVSLPCGANQWKGTGAIWGFFLCIANYHS